MRVAENSRPVVRRTRQLSMQFGLPMAVVLLVIQLAAAFFISKSQGAKIAQDLHTRGQGLLHVLAEVSAPFIVNYDMTALGSIAASIRQQADVRWAVFFDAKSQPLTSAQEVMKDSTTVVFTQAIHSDNRVIGTIEIGLSTASMTQALQKLYMLLALSSLGVMLTTVFILIWLFQGRVSKPLWTITGFAQTIAGGDLSQAMTYHSQNEVGILARALQSMCTHLGQMFRDISGKTVILHQASSALSTMSEQMTQSVSAMSDTATATAAAAKEMSANMVVVAAAATQTTDSAHTVATATEEMTATISEIARYAEQAREATAVAVNNVASTSGRVSELDSAARDISQVTDLITDIAEQTTLLALNATIEAARAGEAGKGFAVVANEVKELAKQTNAATEGIRAKIEAMQRSTAGTMEEITQINQVITQVNDLVTNIASSVEEQSITTRDIARHIAQAATGIEQMLGTVTQAAAVSETIASQAATVSDASTELKLVSGQLNGNAAGLATMGQALKTMVGQFTLAAETQAVSR